MSHITVIVQEVEPRPRKPRKQATRSRAQAAREARQPQTAAPLPAADPETTTTPVATVETSVASTHPDAGE
jgi:large subunit ribosomal protein L22